MEAKAQDVFCSTIREMTPVYEDMQAVVDKQVINQLKAHDVYDQASSKQPVDEPDFTITNLPPSSIWQANLVELNDFKDVLSNLVNLTQPLDLAQKQQNEESIQEVNL